MDREAAVIRAEMSHTRAAIDHKIALLEARASQLTPRQLTRRYLPPFFVDRVIGGILTLVGVRLAWGMYRKRRNRRQEVEPAIASFGTR
jgi:hypothetical protein